MRIDLWITASLKTTINGKILKVERIDKIIAFESKSIRMLRKAPIQNSYYFPEISGNFSVCFECFQTKRAMILVFCEFCSTFKIQAVILQLRTNKWFVERNDGRQNVDVYPAIFFTILASTSFICWINKTKIHIVIIKSQPL